MTYLLNVFNLKFDNIEKHKDTAIVDNSCIFYGDKKW